LDALRQAILTASEELAIALPERPQPDEADVDEAHWLFASERSYVEQLRYYQEHKLGSNGQDNKKRDKR